MNDLQPHGKRSNSAPMPSRSNWLRVSQTLPDGTQIVYVGGIEVTITGTQRITKTYYAAQGCAR